MQDLTPQQTSQVAGGFLPLVVVGAALLLSGCAHCNSHVRKDPPPGK